MAAFPVRFGAVLEGDGGHLFERFRYLKTQLLTPPTAAQRAPTTLRSRLMHCKMVRATMSRPRAALASIRGPVTLAKRDLSDFQDRTWLSEAARGKSAAALATFRRVGLIPPDHSS